MIQLYKQTQQNKTVAKQNKIKKQTKNIYFLLDALVHHIRKERGEVCVLNSDLPSPIQSTYSRAKQQILLVLMSLKMVTVTEFYIHTHTHTYTHTYIHTYMHSYRQIQTHI